MQALSKILEDLFMTFALGKSFFVIDLRPILFNEGTAMLNFKRSMGDARWCELHSINSDQQRRQNGTRRFLTMARKYFNSRNIKKILFVV